MLRMLPKIPLCSQRFRIALCYSTQHDRDVGEAMPNYMTLGNMRANGVRSLIVLCTNSTCRHEAIMNFDSLSGDVPVPSLGPRMRCQRCGQIGADARPNWNEMTRPFASPPPRNV